MHFCIFCLANVAQLTTIYFYLGYFISSSCNRTGTFSKFKNCKQKFKNVKKKLEKQWKTNCMISKYRRGLDWEDFFYQLEISVEKKQVNVRNNKKFVWNIFAPKKQKSPFQGKAFFSKKKIIVHLIFGEGNRSITHRRNKISYSIDKGLGRPLLSKNFPLEVKLQGQLW